MTDAVRFIHDLEWHALAPDLQARAKLSLLDLVGVAAGGAGMASARIMSDFAHEHQRGNLPLLFDGRGASAAGVALAAGMTIDGLDGHDGFNPSKGHIGCALFSAILPFAAQLSGQEMLTTLVMGYEFGARAAMAQHGTVSDYHTSGSWGAVVAAAAVARILRLDHSKTRHALGIAEFHGPRSQMMRCIDHPTMVKDGSAWGAMTGVSSAVLAQAGFTGAPAIIVEQAPQYWGDLRQRWYLREQYHKPYPVCRWAQAPIEAALALRRDHQLQSGDIAGIEIVTFHESLRLATNRPTATDEAQYSTSFPVALALVHGTVAPSHIADAALTHPEVLRLSIATTIREDAHANAVFPGTRLAQVTLTLQDGRRLTSDWHEPRWDHTAPATAAELQAKFYAFAGDALGQARADAIVAAIDALDTQPAKTLTDLLVQPIRRATSSSS